MPKSCRSSSLRSEDSNLSLQQLRLVVLGPVVGELGRRPARRSEDGGRLDAGAGRDQRGFALLIDRDVEVP